MTKLLRIAVFALLPAAGMAACSDDDGTGPETTAEVAGTYHLQTVNNAPLPFVLLTTGTTYTLELTAGFFTLNSNGTFSDSATLRETDAGDVSTDTQSDSGTFTVTNNTVRLRYPDGATLNATINGNTMTFVDQGITFVFQK